MENKLHIDIVGTFIKPGDYFIYAATLGPSPQLNFGRVVELKLVEKYGKMIPKVKAQGLRKTEYNAIPTTNLVTLEHMARILVIDDDKVPQNFKDLIAKSGKKD